jgi:hypothetical protein
VDGNIGAEIIQIRTSLGAPAIYKEETEEHEHMHGEAGQKDAKPHTHSHDH